MPCLACLTGFLNFLENLLQRFTNWLGYYYLTNQDESLWILMLVSQGGACVSYLMVNGWGLVLWVGFFWIGSHFIILIGDLTVGPHLRRFYEMWTRSYPLLSQLVRSAGIIGVLCFFVKVADFIGSGTSKLLTVSYYMCFYVHIVSAMKLLGMTDIYSTTDGIMSITVMVMIHMKDVKTSIKMCLFAVLCLLMWFKITMPNRNAGANAENARAGAIVEVANVGAGAIIEAARENDGGNDGENDGEDDGENDDTHPLV